MSIEAAYVFPLCFIVLLFLCHLGIFQYNQAVLKMTGYECILRTMEDREKEDTVFVENLLCKAQEVAVSRTLGVKDLKVSLHKTPTKLSLTYGGIQNMLEIPIEVVVVYESVCPESALRLSKVFLGGNDEGNSKERYE